MAEPPPRFVHQPKPEYPLPAREQGLEGTVTLQLEMLADGTIGEVKVARSSGHAILDTAAQEVARTWTHIPTTRDGVAVLRWVNLNLTFALDKEPEAGATRQ
jgi:protein TonB